MTTQIQPPQAANWQERLKDSSWVTIGWEWLQVLLGRSVDFVLWITMIFSCYQLIPGAPQAPAGVSTFMFILQFIALDIGGLGLNRLAQQQGLPRWAYARVVAYILIGITLVTISYAGIEHTVTVPLEVTGWIEAMLVIARSIMTVLYGQAIHSLKAQEQSMRDHLAELEEQVTLQQQQLATSQQEVSSLRVQLNTLQQQAFSSGVQLDSPSNGQGKVDSGQRGKVVRLDTNRPRKSGQDAAENAMAEQIRELLTAEPGLSGRALAARLGCSPTTAAKWKGIIETERDAVNQ